MIPVEPKTSFQTPVCLKNDQPKNIKRIIWLVVSTPLKNMKVSWDDEIPNIYVYIYI